MSVRGLMRMTATISTPGPAGGTNTMGDPVPGPATVTVSPCWCTQKFVLRKSEMDMGMGDEPIQHWVLYVPAGTPIDSSSKVTVDAYPGVVWSVNGEPWRAANARTDQPHHVEAQLVATGAGI